MLEKRYSVGMADTRPHTVWVLPESKTTQLLSSGQILGQIHVVAIR